MSKNFENKNSENKRNENKVVFITGASRGIGAQTALLAAKKGWDVAFSYFKQEDKASQIAGQIEKMGQQALAIKMDINNEQDILNAFSQIDQRFNRLDALVNNAGKITTLSQFIDMPAKRIKDVLNTNVVGSFICAQQAVKRMMTSKGNQGGSIVNLSSMAAKLGSPNEFIDYAASKGAIDSFTVGLAKEVALESIRVNAVRPGLIATDMHCDTGDANRAERLKPFIPMQKIGTPLDVANSIVWLMSDEASYITGSILDVSGGR